MLMNPRKIEEKPIKLAVGDKAQGMNITDRRRLRSNQDISIRIAEVASTAQRNDLLTEAFNQCFPKNIPLLVHTKGCQPFPVFLDRFDNLPYILYQCRYLYLK